jgi:hypothetical protein
MGEYPRANWVDILMFVSAWGWHGERVTRIGVAGREPRKSMWAGETAVAGGVAFALLSLALLHVMGSGTLDPLTRTISDYVFLPGGYTLLGLAGIAIATASFVLSRGLRRGDLPDAGPPAGLLLSVAVALVLVAIFPTHDPRTAAGLVSNVHRAAGGWVLVMVPVAGWMVARRARSAPAWQAAAPAVAWCAGVSAVLCALFLLSLLPIVIGGSPGFPLLGGVQRVLYAVVMLVLVVTARATRLAVEHAPGPAALPSGVELRGAM